MKNLMNSEKEFRLNEIIFENRNKNYGAYVLRNEEGNFLKKALFIGVAFFAAIAISPLLFRSFETPVKITVYDGGHVLTPVDETPIIPEVIEPVIPEVNTEATVSLQVPTPTRDSKKQTAPASFNDAKHARIGLDNIEGPPAILQNPPVITPTVNFVPPTVAPKSVNNNPVSKVDVEASFNGGINVFRTKVVNTFETEKFIGSGDLIKTTVTFIVEKDGSISGIKASGSDAYFNREAEKTVKFIKGKWAPAKLNGENVRSYFNFPISMQFE